MTAWQAAGEIQGFFGTPPPPSPQGHVVARAGEAIPARHLVAGEPAHPDHAWREDPSKQHQFEAVGAWRRLFARSIDLGVTVLPVGFLIGFVVALTSPAWNIWIQDPTNSSLFGLLIIPIAFLVDAVIVGLCGNSIGKALLGVHIRDVTDKPLPFGSHLRRNFSVWVYGFGLCIPLIAIFTMVSQARALRMNGTTGYDKGRYRVHGVKLSPMRSIGATAVMVLLMSVVVYLNAEQHSENIAYAVGHSWVNPVTFSEVQIPAGWVSSSHTNERGLPIYVFTYPGENLTVVFGSEKLQQGITGKAYAQAFPFAVKNAMMLERTAEGAPVAGRNSWNTNGYMVADATQKVTVTIVQGDNQMWRTVAVRLNNMPPETVNYRVLCDRLFGSIN
jgi:RDD family